MCAQLGDSPIFLAEYVEPKPVFVAAERIELTYKHLDKCEFSAVGF